MKQPKTKTQRRGLKSAKLAAVRDVASLFGELGRMMWTQRLWWLIPMLLSLIVVGGLLLIGSSPVAPIFYPLF